MLNALVDYNRPTSVGSRLRRRRFARIESLVAEVLAQKGRCDILDVGGSGRYWRLMDQDLLDCCDITVVNLEDPWGADPWINAPDRGTFRFEIGDGLKLPYADRSFDIAHSNSVIEHVGSFADMRTFALESLRVGQRVYIQTPYFWFPMEPHFGFPLIHWLPVPLRSKLITRFGIGFRSRFSSVAEAMDYIEAIHLIDKEQARALFAEGEVSFERVLGLPKSLLLTRDD